MSAADLRIERDRAAQLGQQAVDIARAGSYVAPSGRRVDISGPVQRACEGTRPYPPDAQLPEPVPDAFSTQRGAVNDTTLAAARWLIERGRRVAALNFAAATHPGGGFLHGARAQEEYLARSSALYACLVGQPMYEHHRALDSPLASDYAIYSPAVPIFRGDDHQLLEEPFTVSIVTCAAVHAGHVAPAERGQIEPAMRSRIHRILAIGAAHGHDAYVLGAWGCGAFGNDGRVIARLFGEALDGAFRGVFGDVVFAVTDWSEDQHFIRPFAERFGVLRWPDA